MDVALFTRKLSAGRLPNLTPLVPLRSVPVIITLSPWQIVAGVNDVIFGLCANDVEPHNNSKASMIQKNSGLGFRSRTIIVKVSFSLGNNTSLGAKQPMITLKAFPGYVLFEISIRFSFYHTLVSQGFNHQLVYHLIGYLLCNETVAISYVRLY